MVNEELTPKLKTDSEGILKFIDNHELFAIND